MTTSAIWNVTQRPWRTILAPISMSFSRGVVSDHCSAASGYASICMKLAGFSSIASNSVSNRPIWLVDTPPRSTGLPPTIQRIAGSRPRRSASFTVNRL